MEQHTDELLRRWEAARDDGAPLTPEELCRDRPEDLYELRRKIDALQRIDGLLGLREGDADLAPPAIPNYVLAGELGRGGFGVVYRARHIKLNCEHAVKVLRPHAAALPGAVEGFLREAQTLAKLRGRNTVPIYHADLHQGRPYFVMELIEGGSLANQMERFAAPEAAAALVGQVARAVQLAHQEKLLHRDLKPANILLDEDGRPLVSDFGLVKLLGDRPAGGAVGPADFPQMDESGPAADCAVSAGASTGTYRAGGGRWSPVDYATRAWVGTPPYMAPEQFAGRPDLFSPATDVWALGVILYELLTGRRPFAGDPGRLREAVLRAEPERPRRHNPRVSRRLERVVLRCLRKDPSERYPTAAALADALDRCRPAPRRVGRWLAAVLAAVPLLAVGLGARPPGWEEWLYRRATATATATVTAGGDVELVGPAAAPSYRWRAGRGDVRWHATDGGAGELTVTTLEPSLLELLPDPGRDDYEVSLLLRQEECYNAFAAAAAYVGYTPFQTDEGPQHGAVRVAFADLGPMAQAARDDQGRPCSRMELGLMAYGTSQAHPYRLLATSDQGRQVAYQSASPYDRPGPWRRLSVAVRGDRVSATCHWEAGKRVTLEPARRWADFLRDQTLQGHPDLGTATVPWRPRGGLGLYVYGCKVCVSGFAVRPLPPQ